MKTSRSLFSAALTTATLFNVGVSLPTIAGTFEASEVEQNRFIAVAAPFGVDKKNYQLLILEQITNKQACWSESGSDPVVIDPLLLNFDFSGICGRSIDSNGYSIRLGDQDLGTDYLLRVVQRNDELVLVGTPIKDRKASEIVVGRTHGMSDGFQKIILDPGWHLTRRTYNGQQLGHLYLTGDVAALGTPQPGSPPPATTATPPLQEPPKRELIFTPPTEATATPSSPRNTLPPLPLPARNQSVTQPLDAATVTPSSPENTLPPLPLPVRNQSVTQPIDVPASPPVKVPQSPFPTPRRTVPVFNTPGS